MVYIHKEDSQCTQHENTSETHLLTCCDLQLPHLPCRQYQDSNITDDVGDGIADEEVVLIDTCTWDGLIPSTSNWSAFED